GNGEIMVKGDVVMLGYYKMSEETAAALQDGWFRTGDFGHFTEIGQIVITGRKKNIIILANGKNVYPEELEDAVMSIPYVKEVIVSEYTRSEDGEKQGLSAEVLLDKEKLEAEGISDPERKIKEDVDALCETMPPYKKITRVVVRDTEFAKTTSNKIKRNYAK
ncbi:MAG: AMP-binding protein, partial [Clostridia bacterium]|nr:AMP-binding protein [Clostridia bacterium]